MKPGVLKYLKRFLLNDNLQAQRDTRAFKALGLHVAPHMIPEYCWVKPREPLPPLPHTPIKSDYL